MAKKTAKKVTKKAAVKKAPAKKVAKKAPAKKSTVARDPKKPLTKTQLVAVIAEQTGLEKKQVTGIIDYLPQLMEKELAKPGVFQIPGLLKIEKKKVPAQKAIKNWKNPFTGEIGTKPAKKSYNKIKVRPLKKLKDMA